MPIIISMSDSANSAACPNCARLELLVAALLEKVAKLESRIVELEAQLKTDSSNSSKPPSSDPPWQPPPSSKPSSGKKQGAQPGHPGSFRQRLPPERVQHVVPYIPTVCAHCQTALSQVAGPNDPPPTWHQVSELPAVVAVVTEHQGHARTCPCCQNITRAEIPADIRAHALGPKLGGALSFLSGRCHASKRVVQEIALTVFDATLSLGQVVNLESEMSDALKEQHLQARDAVRDAPVKNVDETGWFKHGKLCWLWLAATASVAFFQIHAKRGKTGLKKLLGKNIFGILCSDRWSAYAKRLLSARQICWAHLKRDFQKLIEWGGEPAAVGRAGKRAVKALFEAWNEFQKGTISRAELNARLEKPRKRLHRTFQRGRDGSDKKTKRFCKRLLKVYDALWTFAREEGVEPTNNHAERMVRPAVMWRKTSFGNHSTKGCRFTERILTIVETLRLQKRPVLDYLYRTLAAHRAGTAAPDLVAA
jgi:transposase